MRSRAGIAYVPPALTEAAFPDLSLADNLAAANVGGSEHPFRLRRRREARDASDTIAALSVRASSARQPMATLSAGDQQKIIVSRWLRRRPKVLLLDQPTRSVDVSARLELHRLFVETVTRGAAAVVVSDDFEELALLADRVLVMEHGARGLRARRHEHRRARRIAAARAGRADMSESGSAREMATPTAAGSDRRDRVLGLLERYALVIVFIAVMVFFSVWGGTSSTFPTAANVKNVLGNQAVMGVLSLAIMIPLVCGEFDFSVGPVAGLAQVLCRRLHGAGWASPLVLAVVLGLAVGALVGIVIGMTVGRHRRELR